MRLLLTADLQIGSGQSFGTGIYGLGSRFADQQEMLGRIAGIAVEQEVDFVCVLGDVFDRAKPEPHEIILFQAFVRSLLQAGMNVFCLIGNHDVRSAALPSALEIFGDDGCVVSLQPSLFPLGPDESVVLASLPWTPPTRLAAQNPGANRDQLNEMAAAALVNGAKVLATRCEVEYPDAKSVLLGHWAISGAVLPTGLDVSLLREPVLELETLTKTGFDLAMFGHIHLAGMLATGPTPVGYTGAPWVNSWGEVTGDHGVWIYDSAGAGALRFLPVEDPKKFVTVDETLAEVTALGERGSFVPTGEMPDVSGAIVRIRYTATEEVARGVDQSAIRTHYLASGATRVIFKPTIIRAERAREASMSEDLGEADALELWLASQEIADPLATDMRRAHEGFLERTA